MENIGEHLLGRHVEHDPRSREFPHRPRKLLKGGKPRSVTHKIIAPALSQGDIGSCVGHTAAQWLNCSLARKNRKKGTVNLRHSSVNKTSYLDDDDARALYAMATRLDEVTGQWMPDDTGSSGLGGAKALQHYGFIDSYTHIFDFPTLCATVVAQPVMLGVNWYYSMFEPNSLGVVQVSGDVAGGHEILIRGIDFLKGYFRLRNHWGEDWGIKGDCFISFADMERLMHEDGDVTVPTLIV